MGQGLVGRGKGSAKLGNIGAEMFRMAQPFGMRLLAADPYADRDVARELGVELVSLADLFCQSDYLAVNCPLRPVTKGLVNAKRLAPRKTTAYLINTACDPIVDETALTEALLSGRLTGAGLDVFEDEPTSESNPLFQLNNCMVTPHALCWMDQSLPASALMILLLFSPWQEAGSLSGFYTIRSSRTCAGRLN